MNILITGGLGYIGSHVSLELSKENKIFIVDNLLNSKIECLNKIKTLSQKKIFFKKCDILKIEKIRKLIKKNNIDTIIHLAALKSVTESFSNESQYYKVNTLGSINLIHLMVEENIKNFIFASTASVYGKVKKNPINENHPTTFNNNPYAISKILTEKYIAGISEIYPKKNFCVLRIFNPAGAHSSGKLGEYNFNTSSNLFPSLARSIHGKKKFLLNTIKKKGSDGTCIRDYIHIEDLAKCFLHIVKSSEKKIGMSLYNVGSGKGTSVKSIINRLDNLITNTIKIRKLGPRKGDVYMNYSSISKIKKDLKWTPEKNLDDICKSFIKWENFDINIKNKN